MCGRQKHEYPHWSSMTDNAITGGGIEVRDLRSKSVSGTELCDLTVSMLHQDKHNPQEK